MEKRYHLEKNFFEESYLYGDIRLLQIGRLYCLPSTIIPLHIHGEFFELTIVTDGKGTITTNGISVNVEKGDIYLSLPCDSHEIKSDKEKPLKYDFFSFWCYRKDMLDKLNIISKEHYAANERIFKSEEIKGLVGTAISELENRQQYSKELIRNIFESIIIHIIRNFDSIKSKQYPANVTDTEMICYNLMNYIDTHIFSLKNLRELSNFSNYTYGYLSSLFKKTTGNNLNDYYREKKLEAAKTMLTENRLKTTEIAEMLGYSSVYAFSKAFSKKYNESPQNYKKRTK